MNKKRFSVSIIYFVIVVLTLLMRVASALDVYSWLGVKDDEAFWDVMIQIVIFGVVPFVSYMLFVCGRGDDFLPAFPMRQNDDETKNDDGQIENPQPSEDENAAFLQDGATENGKDAIFGETHETEDDSAAETVAQFENVQNLVETDAGAPIENSETKKHGKASVMFKEFFEDFGFKKVSGKNFGFTVLLAVCMIIFTSGFSMIWQVALSLIGFTHVPSSTDYSSVGILFKELFFVAVLPGVFEEFTHRGLLFSGYKKTGWKYVLLSALLFALMHQNIVQTGYTFVDGVAMALVFYYTGSIFPSMFMHFLNNAVSVMLGYGAQNGGFFGFINSIENWLFSTPIGLVITFVIVIACGVGAVLILWRMRKDAEAHGRVPKTPFLDTDTLLLVKDPMFVLTVAVGIVATTFSFVWGMLR